MQYAKKTYAPCECNTCLRILERKTIDVHWPEWVNTWQDALDKQGGEDAARLKELLAGSRGIQHIVQRAFKARANNTGKMDITRLVEALDRVDESDDFFKGNLGEPAYTGDPAFYLKPYGL